MKTAIPTPMVSHHGQDASCAEQGYLVGTERLTHRSPKSKTAKGDHGHTCTHHQHHRCSYRTERRQRFLSQQISRECSSRELNLTDAAGKPGSMRSSGSSETCTRSKLDPARSGFGKAFPSTCQVGRAPKIAQVTARVCQRGPPAHQLFASAVAYPSWLLTDVLRRSLQRGRHVLGVSS